MIAGRRVTRRSWLLLSATMLLASARRASAEEEPPTQEVPPAQEEPLAPEEQPDNEQPAPAAPVADASAAPPPPSPRRNDENDEDRTLRITCEYPLVDLPFNAGGWTFRAIEWPSMAQSLSLTKCIYQLGHKGIQAGIRALVDRPIWQKLGVAAFDLLMPGRPLGTAWLHEEWHRSVMTVRGVDSYNEVYDFKLFTGILRVSHVRDAELAALKRDHNPDLVRLTAAGVESSYEMNLALEKDELFRRTTVYNRVLLWLNAIQGAAYVASSQINTPDQFEEESYATEHTEEVKDFVGHDITGWAYDLFRPDEPYASRGIHPGGAGVDRYISRSDLTSGERRYLALQSGLSLLNFVDPFLFGKTYFRASVDEREIRWNATIRHHLTSFGNSIDANVFLASTPIGDAFFAVHGYTNANRPFFGIEGQLVDRPLGNLLLWSPRVMIWQQPRAQAFRTSSGTFGGLVGSRLSAPVAPWFRPYVEIEAKSAGWVAANPYLDAVFTTRAGVASTF